MYLCESADSSDSSTYSLSSQSAEWLEKHQQWWRQWWSWVHWSWWWWVKWTQWWWWFSQIPFYLITFQSQQLLTNKQSEMEFPLALSDSVRALSDNTFDCAGEFPSNAGDLVHLKMANIVHCLGIPLKAFHDILMLAADANQMGHVFTHSAAHYDM